VDNAPPPEKLDVELREKRDDEVGVSHVVLCSNHMLRRPCSGC
jgi:hypothetical protein